MALPRDAEADGSAVVDALAATKLPGMPWDIFVGKNVSLPYGPCHPCRSIVMSAETSAGFSPLKTNEHGVIRVGQTRVTLDSVVVAFKEGATAEAIVHQYPTLALADVYAVLSYYLRNQKEVETYLQQRQARAEQIRQQLDERHQLSGIRERLLARQQNQAGEEDASPGG